MDGIHVVRIWTYITANEGFLRRVVDYVSFMITATIGSVFIAEVDVVIATSPQFFTACAGYLVSRIKKIPYVFELRDLWPDSIKAVGAMRSPAIYRALTNIEYFLYRKSDLIVTVTNSFKEHLVSNGIPHNKIHVITNGVDLSIFIPNGRDEVLVNELGFRGRFICGYIGTLGMAHGLETLLEAAQKILSDGRRDVTFLFVGDGAKKSELVDSAKSRLLSNVVFIDTVTKSEVVRYWSILDVAIVHLKSDKVFTGVIPSKIFESMAMGIPLIHGVPGESSDIVESEQVGIVFNAEDSDGLRDCVYYMMTDSHVRQYYRNRCFAAGLRYGRSELADKMLRLVEGLVGKF
jgi:glycosyltransferase involved in cell wall biosynthesis